MTKYYAIGQLAKKTDCKVETIHYYEKIGLMPHPARTEGGHRIYQLEDIKRLTFIRHCRKLGFDIQQVKSMLQFIDEPNHSCGEVKALAMIHARNIQKKIDDLQRLQTALNKMLTHCKGEELSIDNCPIIDALYFDHEKEAH